MATGDGVNQSKTAFLEEFLPDNRDADIDAVNQAWSAAGNSGTISESLFGKLRSDLGLTGKRGRKGTAAKKTDGPATKGIVLIAPLMPAEIRFYGRYKGGSIRDDVLVSIRDIAAAPARAAWSCDSD